MEKNLGDRKMRKEDNEPGEGNFALSRTVYITLVSDCDEIECRKSWEIMWLIIRCSHGVVVQWSFRQVKILRDLHSPTENLRHSLEES